MSHLPDLHWGQIFTYWEPTPGLEPGTLRLRCECSTIELGRHLYAFIARASLALLLNTRIL